MAITQDATVGTAGAGYPASQKALIYILQNTVAFAGFVLANGEQCSIFPIKAKTFVDLVGYELLIVEGATCLVDIGDEVDPDGYADAVDFDGTVGDFYVSGAAYTIDETNSDLELTSIVGAVLSLVGGKLYTANDTIDADCKSGGGMGTASARFFCRITDFGG